MKLLVTGAAGFIGSAFIDKILEEENWKVEGIDNFDPFYDKEIKTKNIEKALDNPKYRFIEEDIRNYEALSDKLSGDCDAIIHLAAKAGVRPSIENPVEYQRTNVQGTQNLLELTKERGVKRFIFGSSSSVYGVNPNVPWSEDDFVLKPISPYAATKVAGELLGHVYNKLYNIDFVALRFFTVYGPRQRPDLAIHKFAKKIARGETIPFYGDGSSRRDYTYIDDICEGVKSAVLNDNLKYEIINLGNNRTVSLAELVEIIEKAVGKKAKIERLPNQPGDVPQTYADISKARRLLNYSPKTDIERGVEAFVEWLEGEI